MLIDLSEGMRPFRRDQTDIRDAVRAVLGEGAAEVLHFAGAPLWGAGPGGSATRPAAGFTLATTWWLRRQPT